MSEPDDPTTRSGAGADRIEAMLADFRTAPVAPPVTAPPPPPAVASATKRPPKPDAPAARCKQLTSVEFQRCLQTQCREDRYFAHRQCIALYERNARP